MPADIESLAAACLASLLRADDPAAWAYAIRAVPPEACATYRGLWSAAGELLRRGARIDAAALRRAADNPALWGRIASSPASGGAWRTHVDALAAHHGRTRAVAAAQSLLATLQRCNGDYRVALAEGLDALSALVASHSADDLIVQRAADIAPEPVRWLWPGRLALGKLTLLAGDPGVGKSWLSAYLAAQVTRGGAWPDDAECGPPMGDAMLLSAEDSPEDTIVPRLAALGADLSRVHIVRGRRIRPGDDAAGPLDLVEDAGRLEALLRERPVRLLVLDPLAAYLGDTDSHVNAEVRRLLALLSAMAARYGAAVLAVHHLSKSAVGRALYRASGSLAFVAAARCALLLAPHPDDADLRLLATMKCNLAARPATLGFTLSDESLQWSAETYAYTADELLAGDSAENRGSDAAAWLAAVLGPGPRAAQDVYAAAAAAGFSRSSISRAASAMGILREGTGRATTWRLRATQD